MHSSLPSNASIAKPAELKHWLKQLRDLVQRGELRHRETKSIVATEQSVLEIEIDGPWPDYIEWEFETEDGERRYRFAVETYHGAGGTWQLLD